MQIYTVKPGDTVYSISGAFGVPISRIISDNEISDPSRLVAGQSLVIIEPEKTYTVKRGDTLASIAREKMTSVLSLYQNNPSLGGKSTIYPGQTLIIALPPKTFGRAEFNGYVYPYVDRGTLRRTLSYLTYLSIFSYGIKETGGIIDIDDADIIATAKEYGTAPILVLSTLTETGFFSNELAERVLKSEALREATIAAITETVERKGFSGVDVDFEYIPASAAAEYVQFVTDLRAALNPLGYSVFVALAPKTNAAQKGLLYEAHDYPALGKAADALLLMTYEWGYTYGEPMAVAPIGNVEEVVSYAVTEIPPAKLFLGMPNYGYDWKLPYVRGESKARTLGNVEAVDLARDKNAAISFDEKAASPTYNYNDRTSGGSVTHEVWFEDASSVYAKLKLLPKYGLRGAGVWNVMKYFPGMWLTANSLFDIVKL